MSTQGNGGPAFPVEVHQDDTRFQGMTLRDYFAAKAMQAVISGLKNVTLGTSNTENNITVAGVAYAVADAMLATREVAEPNSGERPDNCRNKLRDEGQPYPRSGCAHCKTGGMTGCPFEKGVQP